MAGSTVETYLNLKRFLRYFFKGRQNLMRDTTHSLDRSYVSVFSLTNLCCVFDAISICVELTATSDEHHVPDSKTSVRIFRLCDLRMDQRLL